MYIQTRDPQRQMFLQPLGRGCAGQQYGQLSMQTPDVESNADAQGAGTQQAAIPLAERLFEFMSMDSCMRSFSLSLMTQELLKGLRQIQSQVKHDQLETIMHSLEKLLGVFVNVSQSRILSAESVRQIVTLMTHAAELRDIAAHLKDICVSLSANSSLLKTIDTITGFCENLALYNRIGNTESQPAWYIPLPLGDVFPDLLFAGVLFYPESDEQKSECVGAYRMVIRLESVSLGKISIDCTVRHNDVACAMHVDNAQAESLCHEHAVHLKKRLKQKKMTMRSFQCHCKEIQAVFPYVEVSA